MERVRKKSLLSVTGWTVTSADSEKIGPYSNRTMLPQTRSGEVRRADLTEGIAGSK
jgi:hypothetical protein